MCGQVYHSNNPLLASIFSISSYHHDQIPERSNLMEGYTLTLSMKYMIYYCTEGRVVDIAGPVEAGD